jgi:hypothetical protein
MLTHFTYVCPVKKTPSLQRELGYIEKLGEVPCYNLPVSPLSTRLR